MVPLSNLVRLEEGISPRELNHFDQRRSATISANLADGYALGEALTYLEGIARAILPLTATIYYNGPSREFKPANAILLFVFRSEDHPSELQSLMRTPSSVFCLQKKNIIRHPHHIITQSTTHI